MSNNCPNCGYHLPPQQMKEVSEESAKLRRIILLSQMAATLYAEDYSYEPLDEDYPDDNAVEEMEQAIVGAKRLLELVEND